VSAQAGVIGQPPARSASATQLLQVKAHRSGAPLPRRRPGRRADRRAARRSDDFATHRGAPGAPPLEVRVRDSPPVAWTGSPWRLREGGPGTPRGVKKFSDCAPGNPARTLGQVFRIGGRAPQCEAGIVNDPRRVGAKHDGVRGECVPSSRATRNGRRRDRDGRLLVGPWRELPGAGHGPLSTDSSPHGHRRRRGPARRASHRLQFATRRGASHPGREACATRQDRAACAAELK